MNGLIVLVDDIFESPNIINYIFDIADVFDPTERGKGTDVTTNLVYIFKFNDVKKIKSIKTYKLRWGQHKI